MTTIDDSNTHDSSDTPPYFWFGEISGRLRARTRDELHELDLGRRGWRVLHTLADGPATADELYAALPHRGRRGGTFGGRPTRADRPAEADVRADGDAPSGEQAHAAAAPREWRGHPDWMRREWERRQQMYRAWMEHDSARAQAGPHDHDGHDHHGPDHGGHAHGDEQQGHDSYGPDHGDAHQVHDGHDHSDDHQGHDHDHHHEHDDHSHHDHHGAEQAFERGFERGFVRGVERAHAGHGFGPGGFGYGGFGPGRYGRGYGPGRFGPDAWAHEHSGHGRPPFAGGHGFDGRCRGGVDRILADFVERGWVWFDGDRATLTDEGRAAHDGAAERIRTARATASEGIDPADLATTLATLEAMARNLGWTPNAQEAEESATTTDTEEGTEEGTDAD
ncbi:hypothetical protein ACFRFH_04515 [Leifsonia sp. NPDC056824]|uniref:hypothetical protein n=1 Tax=Leifsonia sp. NPDC056824 TaxID=3345953 RepID=UPI0036C29389